MADNAINYVTFHLDIVGRTSAGTLFGNLEEKLVVMRWESHIDFVEASILSKMLLDELNASGAETLVYDMRRIGDDEGSPFDATMRLAAISGMSSLKNLAWLGKHPELALPDAVSKAILAQGIQACYSSSFGEAISTLTSGTMHFQGAPDLDYTVENFQATYGGSCYNIPELKTTVLRSAGNHFDLPLAKDMYERSFRLHGMTGSSAFVIDTSAIAPIMDVTRYAFAFDALIRPIVQNCKMQQLIHLRVGDPIFPPGVSTPQMLAQAFEDIEFVETTSMQEAVRLIRATRGLSSLEQIQDLASTVGQRVADNGREQQG